jgi:O-antigen ligase
MMIDKKLRILVCSLILIFPVVSNLITHSSSVILVLLALLGLPFCLVKKDRPMLTREEKWIMWAFVAYFAVYLISYALNGTLGTLEDLHIKNLDHEMRMLLIIPIFSLLRTVKMPCAVLWSGVAAGAVAAGVYSIVLSIWLSPGGRVAGSYHAIAFGDLATVLAFMSLLGLRFFRQRHAAYVLIPIMAFGLGTIASILSETRGAWIAVPGFLVILFFYRRRYLNPLQLTSIVILIFLILLSVYKMPESRIVSRVQLVYEEVKNYSYGRKVNKPSATAERIEGWLAAWEIYKEHPVLGAGPGSFKPKVHKMIAEDKRSQIISKYSQPHNAYLAVMADCGTFGILALLAIFILPLWAIVLAIKRGEGDTEVGYAGLILIVGFMHFGLTETIFGRNININFYIIMLSAVISIAAGYRKPFFNDKHFN